MGQGMGMPIAPGRTRKAMPRALRALLWVALAIALLVLVLAAVVLLVNRRDEAPSADARALEAIVASARPVDPADDALAGLASLGATAVEHAGPHAAARLVDAAGRDARSRRAARGERLDDALGACSARRDDCASLLDAAEPDMPAWIARESALLEDYRRVLPRRGWHEGPPPRSPIDWRPAPLSRALQAQELVLMQAFVDAGAGDAAAVREALEADARFWRGGLAGADTLVTKMVATAAVQRNLALGALAVQRLPATAIAAATPPAWKLPVSASERSLLEVLAWEWKLGDHFMRRTDADARAKLQARGADGPAFNALFKPQATSNANAALMRRIADASGAPYPQLQRSLQRLDAWIEDRTRFPYSIYNPVGRILGSIAPPAYADYGRRLADLEARRRAVLAVLGLHAAGIAAAQLPSALASSTHRNPYTGRAFAWDAAASCVRIGGIDRVAGRGCVAYLPPTASPTPTR